MLHRNALASYHLSLKNHDPVKGDQLQQAFLEAWTIREDQETIEYAKMLTT